MLLVDDVGAVGKVLQSKLAAFLLCGRRMWHKTLYGVPTQTDDFRSIALVPGQMDAAVFDWQRTDIPAAIAEQCRDLPTLLNWEETQAHGFLAFGNLQTFRWLEKVFRIIALRIKEVRPGSHDLLNLREVPSRLRSAEDLHGHLFR